VIVWAWHAPALHQAAHHLGWARLLEQGSFLLSGLWLWLSVLGGSPSERMGRSGSGVLALLLTSMHMTLLGALVALPTRPLYAHHGGLLGLTPLEDQQLGGAIMLLVGGLVYLAGGLWLSARLVRRTQVAPSDARATRRSARVRARANYRGSRP
jgi:putative membrane protein